MKCTLAILVSMGIYSGLGFLQSAAAAAELKADSRVASVTVYADRALVTRAATVRLQPGENDVVFSGLPAGLTEDSVSAGIRSARRWKTIAAPPRRSTSTIRSRSAKTPRSK